MALRKFKFDCVHPMIGQNQNFYKRTAKTKVLKVLMNFKQVSLTCKNIFKVFRLTNFTNNFFLQCLEYSNWQSWLVVHIKVSFRIFVYLSVSSESKMSVGEDFFSSEWNDLRALRQLASADRALQPIIVRRNANNVEDKEAIRRDGMVCLTFFSS
jgi:hypothetical protein